ncbi:MAG: hypothetical protein K2X38_16975 [Gemmataceae bacterium]|nr:hypothetical protein [Gemmataceae bacterium]
MTITHGVWYQDRETGLGVMPLRPHFGASASEGLWLCKDEFGLLGNYRVEYLEDTGDEAAYMSETSLIAA